MQERLDFLEKERTEMKEQLRKFAALLFDTNGTGKQEIID